MCFVFRMWDVLVGLVTQGVSLIGLGIACGLNSTATNETKAESRHVKTLGMLQILILNFYIEVV